MVLMELGWYPEIKRNFRGGRDGRYRGGRGGHSRCGVVVVVVDEVVGNGQPTQRSRGMMTFERTQKWDMDCIAYTTDVRYDATTVIC